MSSLVPGQNCINATPKEALNNLEELPRPRHTALLQGWLLVHSEFTLNLICFLVCSRCCWSYILTAARDAVTQTPLCCFPACMLGLGSSPSGSNHHRTAAHVDHLGDVLRRCCQAAACADMLVCGKSPSLLMTNMFLRLSVVSSIDPSNIFLTLVEDRGVIAHFRPDGTICLGIGEHGCAESLIETDSSVPS